MRGTSLRGSGDPAYLDVMNRFAIGLSGMIAPVASASANDVGGRVGRGIRRVCGSFHIPVAATVLIHPPAQDLPLRSGLRHRRIRWHDERPVAGKPPDL